MKIILFVALFSVPVFSIEDVAGSLHTEIANVAPIESVQIGKREDKATWKVYFKPEATPDQRAAAQQVLQEFDPATVTKPVTEGSADWSIIALWIAVGALAVKVGLDPKVLRSESEAQASVDSKKV